MVIAWHHLVQWPGQAKARSGGPKGADGPPLRGFERPAQAEQSAAEMVELDGGALNPQSRGRCGLCTSSSMALLFRRPR
ncbi:hypothetical protein EBO15_01710 [Actinomadura harenae]|uniref:Uncharacterized protein n=1 Tax=Actinomadura harenae TaxID=2483351 RepID=A0A3M2MDN8_9ACTN|nr:hypothetical protein EBO15_01710 [Actinomadura harenae]